MCDSFVFLTYFHRKATFTCSFPARLGLKGRLISISGVIQRFQSLQQFIKIMTNRKKSDLLTSAVVFGSSYHSCALFLKYCLATQTCSRPNSDYIAFSRPLRVSSCNCIALRPITDVVWQSCSSQHSLVEQDKRKKYSYNFGSHTQWFPSAQDFIRWLTKDWVWWLIQEVRLPQRLSRRRGCDSTVNH